MAQSRRCRYLDTLNGQCFSVPKGYWDVGISGMAGLAAIEGGLPQRSFLQAASPFGKLAMARSYPRRRSLKTSLIRACVFRHFDALSSKNSVAWGGNRARLFSLACVARRLRSRRTMYHSVCKSWNDFRRNSAAVQERPLIERCGSWSSWATRLHTAMSDTYWSSTRLLMTRPSLEVESSNRNKRKKCQRPWFGLTLILRWGLCAPGLGKLSCTWTGKPQGVVSAVSVPAVAGTRASLFATAVDCSFVA